MKVKLSKDMVPCFGFVISLEKGFTKALMVWFWKWEWLLTWGKGDEYDF